MNSPALPLGERSIGLGCMRLSTARDRDDEGGVATIHAALDAGVTLLDTSDAYCHNEHDVGHNERLIARALASWSGDRRRIVVATKGGIRRPKGAWVNDGRAKHLREACEASCRALGVDAIELYQLHAVDPKIPIETSVRALAALKSEGRIRHIGLCNVTVGQIQAARSIAEIATVQVSLSVLDDENLRNGVAEYCRDHQIRLVAYRPLGGERVKRLAKDPMLSQIASKHSASAEQVALAWLLSFGGLIPIPGATRVETAQSIGRALSIELDGSDRDELDRRFSGRLLRIPRSQRRPSDAAEGDVVIVMGMPGGGKSTVARDLEARGYQRLNRDAIGGTLADLVPLLDEALGAGRRHAVLDNTYPTRRSRNEVIEAAWSHGVPVRCVWITTEIGDAQVNAIVRMIEALGRLPTPEEIRERGKADPRFLLPDALFRYERTLEPPSMDEGFSSIELRRFRRDDDARSARALILDFDDLLERAPLRPGDVALAAGRRETLARYHDAGWLVFAHAWRPQVAKGEASAADVEACFARVRELLGFDIDFAFCPHDAGPPVCWCRKPIPGQVIEFAMRRGVSVERSIVVTRSAADRTMAQRLGAQVEETSAFFS